MPAVHEETGWDGDAVMKTGVWGVRGPPASLHTKAHGSLHSSHHSCIPVSQSHLPPRLRPLHTLFSVSGGLFSLSPLN